MPSIPVTSAESSGSTRDGVVELGNDAAASAAYDDDEDGEC